MARSRGASALFEPTPLDRQGNPISPAAAYLKKPMRISGSTVAHGPGIEPVPPEAPIIAYRCDPRTWSRNMEAYDLARLLHLYFKRPDPGDGFSIEVTLEEYQALDGNLRQHFMPVRQS